MWGDYLLLPVMYILCRPQYRATLAGQIDTWGLTVLCLPGKSSWISAWSPAYIGHISQEVQMRAAWPGGTGSGSRSWHSLVHGLNPEEINGMWVRCHQEQSLASHWAAWAAAARAYHLGAWVSAPGCSKQHTVAISKMNCFFQRTNILLISN